MLKEEAKQMLVAGDTPQCKIISFIDDIQRLGLAYHFEAELDAILQHLKDSFLQLYCSKDEVDLHDAALCFRLLRQQGHVVSSGSLIVINPTSCQTYILTYLRVFPRMQMYSTSSRTTTGSSRRAWLRMLEEC